LQLLDIYNYLDIDGLYATSGQPSEAQFQLIRNAGYQTVINLAPNSVFENAVVNEREILTKLGMEYIHIPVDFKRPGKKKYQAFVSTLQQNADKNYGCTAPPICGFRRLPIGIVVTS